MRQSIFAQGSELGWRFPSQCRMRMIQSIIHEPLGQLSHNMCGILKVSKRDVGSFKGSNERLGHSVAFRASYGRLDGHQSNIPPKPGCLLVDVAGAIVGEPFDVLTWNSLGESGFKTQNHKVPDHVAGDACSGRYVGQNIPVAAIQGKGHADLLAVKARNLKAIGTPANIAFRNRNLTFMSTLNPVA